MITSPILSLNRWILVAVGSILLSTMACQVDLGGPEIPSAAIQTSEDAADSLRNQWQALVLEAETQEGRVQLIVDEQQLTSFIRTELDKQQDPILKQPTVRLDDGLIQVYGQVERNLAKARVLVEVEVTVAPSGQPTFEITSAEFGPMPLPEAIKDSIEAIISEAFAGSIGPFLTGIRLETIAIANGEMAIIGELR